MHYCLLLFDVRVCHAKPTTAKKCTLHPHAIRCLPHVCPRLLAV